MYFVRAFIFISLGIFLLNCSKEKDPPNKITRATITTAKVISQPAEVTESLVGTITSIIDPKIMAEVSGRVVKILVQVGDTVRVEQILAILDNQDTQHKAEELIAETDRITGLLTQQIKLVERNEKLKEQQFISQNAFEMSLSEKTNLENQLLSAKARLKQVQLQSKKSTLVSPVAGRIEKKLISEGDYLKVGDSAFQIVGNKKLRAHFPIPEQLASQLSVGMKIYLFRNPVKEAEPVKKTVSTLKIINPQVDLNTRTLDIMVDIPESTDWQAGASINGELVLETKEKTLWVPETSVVLRPAGEVVYVVHTSVTQAQKIAVVTQKLVKVGLHKNSMIEIIDGLSVGDIVAKDGASFLTDGASVSF